MQLLGRAAPCLGDRRRRVQQPHGQCLRPPTTVRDSELDALTGFQAGHPGRQGRRTDVDVLAPVLCDEPEALLRVVPLDLSGRHNGHLHTQMNAPQGVPRTRHSSLGHFAVQGVAGYVSHRRTALVVQVKDQCGDVPGVVVTPVVAAFQREAGGSRACAMPGRLRRPCASVNLSLALVWSRLNGYSACGVLALAGELVAVVVAPARPRDGGRCGGRVARVRQASAKVTPCVDLLLGEAGQLGAEGADGGTLRAHQDPVLGEAGARVEVDHGQADLDDLADLAGRAAGPPSRSPRRRRR